MNEFAWLIAFAVLFIPLAARLVYVHIKADEAELDAKREWIALRDELESS